MKKVGQKDLRGYYLNRIQKSLKYLEYTYHRAKDLPTKPSLLTNEQFEIWDSFATRFARTSDLFLSKYIKAAVSFDDPAFDGVFRDYLGRAEKMGLIDNTEQWLEIRELRNIVVHEYDDDDLELLLKKLKEYSPMLIELKTRLTKKMVQA